MDMTTVSLDEVEATTCAALIAHGAEEWVATEVAKAVRVAEATGNLICGLYYVESYCLQLKSGRVNGYAQPDVTRPKAGAVLVDAKYGFAQAAFKIGFEEAVAVAQNQGIAVFSVTHAHTCTSLGYFTNQIAQAGMIGIGFTNASTIVAPPGGSKPVLGTNPMAMSVPAKDGGVAFQFDQSTSAVALGKITKAKAAGTEIPLGWALDSDGNPTTDPAAALKGSLVSTGGYKGWGFGLMVEVMAAALTGSLNSTDVKGLKLPEGKPHDLGQTYLLIDPEVFSGPAFWERLTQLGYAVHEQPNARLPGEGKTHMDPVTIDAAAWARVVELSGG
jgi:(2R)-3-sulfolactate dehydrogenase (NADP+)